MQSSFALQNQSLDRLIHGILASRRITRHDQQCLMVSLSDSPNEYERSLLDRVYDALRQGLLRVVD
ncbi:MAG TPA: hypothetical protein ACFE0H_10275 [Elainellaceae cyanobacterium]